MSKERIINTSINQRINACMARMRALGWWRLSASMANRQRPPSTGAAERQGDRLPESAEHWAAELEGGQSKEWSSSKHAKAARRQVDRAQK